MYDLPRVMEYPNILILIMRFVDMFWTVVPFFMTPGKGIDTTTVLLNIGVMVVLGLAWMYQFREALKHSSPLPTHDIRLEEALSHVQS